MSMIHRLAVVTLLGVFVAGVPAMDAEAQTSTRVDAKRDWSIFEAEADGNKICWVVTQPKSKAAFRDGQRVEVRRGDIFLMVAVRPADNVTNEVSFIAGYPFQQGSTPRRKAPTTSLSCSGERSQAFSPSV
ncbi:MAG: hypothetical protein AAFV96_04630, partial [Pseudomonadota bacterium]